jgi:hypothetical protein
MALVYRYENSQRTVGCYEILKRIEGDLRFAHGKAVVDIHFVLLKHLVYEIFIHKLCTWRFIHAHTHTHKGP